MKQIDVLTRKGETVSLAIDLDESNVRYGAQSKNSKTGNLPTQWIGTSREESMSTCTPCPLLTAGTCYSQFGTPRMGLSSINKVDIGKRSLKLALEGKHKDAKYFRMAAIGDSGSIKAEVYLDHDKQIREAGLGVLNYTHHWHLEHAQHLKGLALASCDTMEDVKDATEQGWRAALHVDRDVKVFDGKSINESPQGRVGGKKYFLCPNSRPNHLQCNDCGLCDGKRPSNVDVIVFIEHGITMKASKK